MDAASTVDGGAFGGEQRKWWTLGAVSLGLFLALCILGAWGGHLVWLFLAPGLPWDAPLTWMHIALQAWLCTGLALFGVGLLITWTSLPSGASSGDLLLPWLGVAMAALGAASSTRTMIAYRRCWPGGTRHRAATGDLALVLAGLVAMFGAVLVLILLADAC